MNEQEVREAEEHAVKVVRDYFTGDLEAFEDIGSVGVFGFACELRWEDRTGIGFWVSDVRRWVQAGLFQDVVNQITSLDFDAEGESD